VVKIQTKIFLLTTLKLWGALGLCIPPSAISCLAGRRACGWRHGLLLFSTPYSIVVLLFTRTLFACIIVAVQYLSLHLYCALRYRDCGFSLGEGGGAGVGAGAGAGAGGNGKGSGREG
jgi:hypothetical protein